ncbi:bifunctional phosphoribosyl-AMP cyclohydrolase/phosphoribosyl-ATP diphosphatase HisIE [Leeuwenhoekiella palythoae]|uniref:bifunctional phosphoribosyl-AMP cyclohydrolase/phosphoribosyl-ATP diphosphatase HisIE n=1 Tax=Leeuwenhoekiella palythoae TaxID=573501 RepID=UPI000E8093CC|nr:bifunctional phosphoribosyl-AMP cyclohydrolase/phosphoribosyl-ATP diphosphatase HisIE [Leeuwenhoekiella palythoae]UBZ10325.1 bifunctional phosphoribosyl-AMP cyclohydrolase/phosphoribosyl-ATP diphosphatase HisIE [Leeuwenhoekiella palythoae]HAX16541.1 bifunctional phosphoribosyl-AMP cyclohydrolase/phosphoribosyl-ATP diphosphatase [Leeuwenhoekiella sp.]HBO29350.1 bifunctional phosphoribosyl-AMP cyclohydrolase/phosphoribosyl-ATP diphosphatase [Leeuwenhoekiella sp.]|tara:strand:+ start:600 stop:1193 length:594 start_codon:yes stop_codon:yes gene_type:complete
MEIKYDENGLVPAIIQDAKTKTVLMLGYMNEEAYLKTNTTKKVTFYSRSKQRLWTKGEESGNFLNLVAIKNDCDNDSLLVTVNPVGPTCHTGTDNCWGEDNKQTFGFLTELEQTIADRKGNQSNDDSYVASLFRKGINKIAQKVGEEAVEVVIEAKDDNDDLFLNESADLLFHYLILLKAKGFGLSEIEQVLLDRKK